MFWRLVRSERPCVTFAGRPLQVLRRAPAALRPEAAAAHCGWGTRGGFWVETTQDEAAQEANWEEPSVPKDVSRCDISCEFPCNSRNSALPILMQLNILRFALRLEGSRQILLHWLEPLLALLSHPLLMPT